MLNAIDLPEEEILCARSILRGEYYQDHQSLLSRSREAASMIVKGFQPDLDQKIIEKASKIDAAEVRDLINKYINWDKRYTLTVKP